MCILGCRHHLNQSQSPGMVCREVFCIPKAKRYFFDQGLWDDVSEMSFTDRLAKVVSRSSAWLGAAVTSLLAYAWFDCRVLSGAPSSDEVLSETRGG